MIVAAGIDSPLPAAAAAAAAGGRLLRSPPVPDGEISSTCCAIWKPRKIHSWVLQTQSPCSCEPRTTMDEAALQPQSTAVLGRERTLSDHWPKSLGLQVPLQCLPRPASFTHKSLVRSSQMVLFNINLSGGADMNMEI